VASDRIRYAALLLLALFVRSNMPLQAQHHSRPWSGWAGGVTLGGIQLNTQQVNNKLPPEYPHLKPLGFMAGANGFGVFNGWLVGGEIFGMLSPDVKSDSVGLALRGGAAFLNAGHLLRANKNYMIYALVGAGGGLSQLRRTNLQPNTNPGHNTLEEGTLRNGHFGLTASVGYMAFMGKEIRGMGGFGLGARLGYMLLLPADSRKIGDGYFPKISAWGPSGPFLQIIIGGGNMWQTRG
jgi:hypothetical protein